MSEEVIRVQKKAKSKSTRVKIFGQSVCLSIARLGKAGVKVKQAMAIMDQYGVHVKPSSIVVQLSVGRNGGPMAELTDQQIEQLKAMAPESKAE